MNSELPDETVEEEVEEEVEEPVRKKKKRRSTLGAAPAPAEWNPDNHDVETLWPQLLQHLKAQGKTPYDVDIQVKRIDPNECPLHPSINGGAVQGSQSESPSDALIRVIDDVFHCPNTHGAAEYLLLFFNKQTNLQYTRGRLRRPAPEEIERTRAAQYRARPRVEARHHQPYEPQGYGAPPQPQHRPEPQPYAYDQRGQPQPPPPWYQGYGAPPPPWGYPQPPPQQQHYQDPEVVNLRAQVGQLTGQLGAVLDFMKQQGVQAPPGLAAPPPPLPPTVQGVPQAATAVGNLSALLGMVKELKGLGLALNETFNPGSNVEPEPVAAIAPPNPDDELPFKVLTVTGTNMKYALNKETGGVDFVGTGLANLESDVGKKVLEIVQNGAAALARSAGIKTDGSVEAIADTQPKQLPATNGAGWPTN